MVWGTSVGAFYRGAGMGGLLSGVWDGGPGMGGLVLGVWDG